MESKLAPDGHLSSATILAYVKGERDALTGSEVEEHLQTCDLCSDLIRNLDTLLRGSNGNRKAS